MLTYEFIKTMSAEELEILLYSWVLPYIAAEPKKVQEETRLAIREFLHGELKGKAK